jgi:hypothetical protein
MATVNRLKNTTSVFLHSLFQKESAYVLIFIGILAVIISVVTLLPSLAADSEIRAAEASESLSTIWSDPLNAPHKLATYAATSLVPTVRAVRAVSFLIFAATCIAFFLALRFWHSTETATITTLAFATNAIVLAVSRLGTPLVSLMSIFIFVSFLLWQLHSRSNRFLPIILLITSGIMLYTPGAPWFALLLVIVYWDRLKPFLRAMKRPALLTGLLIALIISTPLLWHFTNQPSAIREWLLLPSQLELGNILRNILRVPSAFIYRMPVDPLLNIARLPVFDIASGMIFLVGLNAYRQKIRLDRTRILAASGLLGMLLGALGSTTIAVVMLLPFAYTVIAAGVEYLLTTWFSVFPKNPIAKSFGTVILFTVILFSSYYQLTRFFVVWPQTLETREVYQTSRMLDSR